MRKLYPVLVILFFFNCANAQESANEKENDLEFDNSTTIKNLEEEQLIFELEKNKLTNNNVSEPLLNPEYPPNQSQNTIVSEQTNNQDVSAFLPTEENTVDQKRLDYIKGLYQSGQFFLLAQSALENNEFEAQYYQALGNYNIVKKSKDYQGKLNSEQLKEKNELIKTAKNNLYRVGINSANPKLKEKAIFWHGVVSVVYPNSAKDEKELTETFLFIEDTMKSSSVYNDALAYLMMIYKKIGKINKAKEYYQKILRTSPNDLVYNYKSDRLVPAKKIVELYRDLK